MVWFVRICTMVLCDDDPLHVMLYYSVLCSIKLYCVVCVALCCTVLCCVVVPVLCCLVLGCVVLY